MCDCQLTRREALLTGGVAAGVLLSCIAGPATPPASAAIDPVEVMPGLFIMPRSSWGADLAPKGPLATETPLFFLVHHTASSNNYRSALDVIRSTYAWQTSPAKGWNDVCHNFFIGRDGTVFEGRAGSLWRPVVADATGGSQGFAQLICLLGDFTSTQPTAAARASLAKVIAWLSDRYQISIAEGATTTFTSRGSQRWAAGRSVTTATIAGHRDMSYTACPGDSLYPMLDAVRVSARTQRDAWSTVLKPARRLGLVQP